MPEPVAGFWPRPAPGAPPTERCAHAGKHSRPLLGDSAFSSQRKSCSDWATEDLAKLGAQGIHPDSLDGQRLLMEAVVAAPPEALPDMRPIGGRVTAAPEAVFLDKGLGQDQILLIDLPPV